MFIFNYLATDHRGVAGTIFLKKENDPRGSSTVINSNIEDIYGDIWRIRGQVGHKLLAINTKNINQTCPIIEYRTYNIKII